MCEMYDSRCKTNPPNGDDEEEENEDVDILAAGTILVVFVSRP
jgi:hypothetical protein